MSGRSKYINLLIEFEEKIQASLNKKYKAFTRSLLNLESLTRTVRSDQIFLTKQIIVFKLGLEAKSLKAIEISLTYLLKLFQQKYIDVHAPNYCEKFVIEETNVRELEGERKYEKEMRQELVRLIRPLVHFKSNQIHLLMLKVLEFLISQPILELLLQLSHEYNYEPAPAILLNYFSFRFYVYEELYLYKESQMTSFEAFSIKSQRTDKEIEQAIKSHNNFKQLLKLYMNEYISIIEGGGGHYGVCVMCGKPAQNFCKITRASLCSIECKDKHMDIAEKQYKNYFQASSLWDSIIADFKTILIYLEQRQSPLVFSVLVNLLDKPHLFMQIKPTFRQLIETHMPTVLTKAISYKNQSSFEYIYLLVASLTKYWLYECLVPLEYFYKEYFIKILEDKKPSFTFLQYIFRALAKIVESGKALIQLYVNFDCEINQENIVQKLMFQVGRISQDRFNNGNHHYLQRHERNLIKSHCLSLNQLIAKGLNQYRKSYPQYIDSESILLLKQKKTSLEKFTMKFNQHWTIGLKTLFNLNLVGLDSNQQIVDILINLRGLQKEKIDELLFCEKGKDYRQIFFQRIKKKSKIGALQLFHYIPIKKSSIGIKQFAFSQKDKEDYEQNLNLWAEFLNKPFNFEKFSEFLIKNHPQFKGQPQKQINHLFRYAVKTSQKTTSGNHKLYFTYCCSHSYLEALQSQISLLQIPIAFWLQTDYQVERVGGLIGELMEICGCSNWLSILIKNTSISKFPYSEFDEVKLKTVLSVLALLEHEAAFIQDWSTITYFISYLHQILVKIENRQITQSKIILSQHIQISTIQNCLESVGNKTQKFFSRFMKSLLSVGREQGQKGSLWMIQMFFGVATNNPKKTIASLLDLMPELHQLVNNLAPFTTQNMISIIDMLKQLLAKLTKNKIKSNEKIWQKMEPQYFRLFISMSKKYGKNRDVKDFIINSISMSILHNCWLRYDSWKIVMEMMTENVKEYRGQIYSILEKIISEKLKPCPEFYGEIIDLCLLLIDQQQIKISTEALHSLRQTIEILISFEKKDRSNKSINESEESQDNLIHKQVESAITKISKQLVSSLFYNCHQPILQVLFLLLSSQMIAHSSLDEIIEMIFEKIKTSTSENLFISQKTLTSILKWSVDSHYTAIVKHLKLLIIGNWDFLALGALRCIKTYIQLICNGDQKDQVRSVEKELTEIVIDCAPSKAVNLSLKNKFEDSECKEVKFVDEQLTNEKEFNIVKFTNKSLLLRLSLDLLPNDLNPSTLLVPLLQQLVAFNDNLYLHCLLWRAGLSTDKKQPPNLLNLQEQTMKKMVNIYSWAWQNANQGQLIFDFGNQIVERYCSCCKKGKQIEQIHKNYVGDRDGFENVKLMKIYLNKRKEPLFKMIIFYLPKWKKMCDAPEKIKKTASNLVKICKYVQNREPFLKLLRELTAAHLD